MLRFRTLLVLFGAIAVPVWLWLRGDPQHVTLGDASNSSKSALASTATRTDDRLPASIATGDQPRIAAPVTHDADGTASGAPPARTERSASVRLDVHAPAAAHVGDLSRSRSMRKYWAESGISHSSSSTMIASL